MVRPVQDVPKAVGDVGLELGRETIFAYVDLEIVRIEKKIVKYYKEKEKRTQDRALRDISFLKILTTFISQIIPMSQIGNFFVLL